MAPSRSWSITNRRERIGNAVSRRSTGGRRSDVPGRRRSTTVSPPHAWHGSPSRFSNVPLNSVQRVSPQLRHLTASIGEPSTIREGVRRFLGGESISDLRKDLSRRGITTPLGNPWQTYPLATVLASARIAGWRDTPARHNTRRSVGTPFLASKT